MKDFNIGATEIVTFGGNNDFGRMIGRQQPPATYTVASNVQQGAR